MRRKIFLPLERLLRAVTHFPMIIFLTMWTAMAALAVACAKQFEFSGAVAAWTAVAAIVCAIGSFLISRQPIGVATTAGRFGAALIRWGFRAGRGRLTLAAMISYLIWLILGTATITAIDFPAHLPIVVAWSGDLLGLFYVVGVALANRGGRIPAPLVKLVASLGGLIVVSIFLWFHAGSDRARAVAVAVAGGPPLFVGAIWGFVLAMGALSGRSRHH